MKTMIHGTMSRRAFGIAGLSAVLASRATLAQPATPASPVAASEALYRVDLPAESLPGAPIVVGAAGVTMAAGTTVEYPEGSSGRSVAIDHVIAGGYEVESESDLIHIDAAGSVTEIAAGATTAVAAGETIVYLHNEAAQRITAGDEETRTFTMGLFGMEQGTNQSTVVGTLDQQLLGGVAVESVPESGVTVTVVPPDQAASVTGSVAEFPVTLESGEQWAVVVLPLAD